MIGKFALAMGASSLACAQPIALGTVNSGLPPVRYQGNSVAIVVFTDRAGIDANCGVADPPNVVIACTRHLQNGAPVVFMPNACFMGQTEFLAKIMCHEMGHVQGWGADHEE